MTGELFTPLPLASGAVLPTVEPYRRWATGDAGLLITGNVMVHAEALPGPADGGAVWIQVNHPGRRVAADMPGVTWGPSEVGVDLGRHSGRFGRPSAMTADQVADTVRRFAVTAARAGQAGFDGVEIRAAHGYLLSQFLSPPVNRRTDAWGGPPENRARLLLDTVGAVRAAVAPSSTVAVKLNSADFQRGGFDAEDARRVIGWLAPLGVDLVELSGGSYESPAMTGRATDGRTRAREAYFLEPARELVATSPLPPMLTGGVTRRATAEQVPAEGVALVGLGTALAVTPDLPARRRRGDEAERRLRPVEWRDEPPASAASMAQVRHQLRRPARGGAPRPGVHPAAEQLRQRRALRRYRGRPAARSVDRGRMPWDRAPRRGRGWRIRTWSGSRTGSGASRSSWTGWGRTAGTRASW